MSRAPFVQKHQYKISLKKIICANFKFLRYCNFMQNIRNISFIDFSKNLENLILGLQNNDFTKKNRLSQF